jgi:hypothetical protein
LFLLNFFENPSSELWLYFFCSHASFFHEAMEKVHEQRITYVN